MQCLRFDSILYSGSDIPGWFSNQSMGASITMQFPSNMDQFKVIAFCIVFEFKKSSRKFFDYYFDPEGLLSPSEEICCDSSILAEMDSVLVWTRGTKNFHGFSGNACLVTFRPYGHTILDKKEIGKYCKIKKCGFCLLQ